MNVLSRIEKMKYDAERLTGRAPKHLIVSPMIAREIRAEFASMGEFVGLSWAGIPGTVCDLIFSSLEVAHGCDNFMEVV